MQGKTVPCLVWSCAIRSLFQGSHIADIHTVVLELPAKHISGQRRRPGQLQGGGSLAVSRDLVVWQEAGGAARAWQAEPGRAADRAAVPSSAPHSRPA